jgi:hypothetical protein
VNRRARGVLLGLCLVSVLSEPAAAQSSTDQYLKGLGCVDIKAYGIVESKGRDLNVTGPRIAAIRESEFDDALLVALKSKVPRLSVSTTCPNRLVLNVQLYDLSTTNLQVHFGVADLSLFRQATILETKQSTRVVVWSLLDHFWGPPSEARTSTLSALDSLVTSFSASYYRASGNQ